MKFFPGQGKVREFCEWSGNLERTWKVREKSWNLKINGYGRQTSDNINVFCSIGEKMYFLMRKSKPISLLIGATLKGKNLLPWGANSFL